MDWIKVMTNLLDHRKIKMIRKGPEGNTLILLWLLMLAEAGKCSRGGYLMISDSLPYSAETLSMVTDISLPTVQLGLTTFIGLDMIDLLDGAIFVRNWGRYQSEDKLEARRENDRQRQQRHRQKERDKMRALPAPDWVSRDSYVNKSRDITEENRTETRVDNTIEQIRLLLSGTPFSMLSESNLNELANSHGYEKLQLVADICAETWRRERKEISSPGGYLNTLCGSLIVPSWYVPHQERMKLEKDVRQRKADMMAEKVAMKEQEEAQALAINILWGVLSDEQQKKYCEAAVSGLPDDLIPYVAVESIAKLLAWEETQSHIQE